MRLTIVENFVVLARPFASKNGLGKEEMKGSFSLIHCPFFRMVKYINSFVKQSYIPCSIDDTEYFAALASSIRIVPRLCIVRYIQRFSWGQEYMIC